MKVLKWERFYFIKLAGDMLRFRNILRKKNKGLEPMIQIETKIDKKWLPVLRCDRGHGFLHIDIIDKDGKQKKRQLASKDTVCAIVEVIDLLKRDWKGLFEELHYEQIASYFVSHESIIKSELDNARDYLLNEAKQPDLIRESRGKGVITFSGDATIKK
jgi:hypothetical protein